MSQDQQESATDLLRKEEDEEEDHTESEEEDEDDEDLPRKSMTKLEIEKIRKEREKDFEEFMAELDRKVESMPLPASIASKPKNHVINMGLIADKCLDPLFLKKASQDEIADALLKLKRLRLDRLGIKKLENLECLNEVVYAYFQHNEIEEIDGLEFMYNLKFLALFDNKITKLQNMIPHLNGLEFLDISANQIAELDVTQLPTSLRILNMSDNPCCKDPEYRAKLLRALPRLQLLDNIEVTKKERLECGAAVDQMEEDEEDEDEEGEKNQEDEETTEEEEQEEEEKAQGRSKLDTEWRKQAKAIIEKVGQLHIERGEYEVETDEDMVDSVADGGADGSTTNRSVSRARSRLGLSIESLSLDQAEEEDPYVTALRSHRKMYDDDIHKSIADVKRAMQDFVGTTIIQRTVNQVREMLRDRTEEMLEKSKERKHEIQKMYAAKEAERKALQELYKR